MSIEIIIAIISGLSVVGGFIWLRKKPQTKPLLASHKASGDNRLTKGLSKTRTQIWDKLTSLFESGWNEETQAQIEEILYSADMSGKLIEKIMASVENKKDNLMQVKAEIRKTLEELMAPVQAKIQELPHQGTKVIMIVGVNGAGKTTTIGKIAMKLKNQGHQVVVGACDTFRAAAVEQLQVWCDRAQVTMIKAQDGSDPSGVGFDALKKAQEQKADYCLLDTAGRLHNSVNLMEELKKSKRVLAKLDPTAPHEIFLVIDSITGQNALRQAEEFHKALNLTGLILTKCDGSSRAGNAVSIVSELQVPIHYIGVGEDVEDLQRFDTASYLDALMGLN